MVLDMNASVSFNTTAALGDKLSRLDRNVTQLKTRTDDLFTGFVKLIEVQREASDNSTLLENGLQSMNKTIRVVEQNHTNTMTLYQNLEKHFVELKRDVFESHVNFINLNSSLHSPEGLRQDLLSLGQAMANTSYLITERIDELNTFAYSVQSQVYETRNSTETLHRKLEDFLTVNFTNMEQINLNGLKSIKYELGKHSLGLAGLMNFSLEIDNSIKLLEENVTNFSILFSGNIQINCLLQISENHATYAKNA